MKKRAAGHASHERWLVSYADFITLLFALFVVLYSASKTDAAKYKAVAESMSKAFSPSGSAGAPGGTGGSGAAPQSQDQKALKQLGDMIDETLHADFGADALREKVEISTTEEGLVIRLFATAFFQSGSAQVNADALPILDHIAKVLATAKREIRVEGHTDDEKISGSAFASNWELSSARASSVVRHLLSNFAFEPARIEAVGRAEFHPIAENSTPEGRAKNRRVELLVQGRDE